MEAPAAAFRDNRRIVNETSRRGIWGIELEIIISLLLIKCVRVLLVCNLTTCHERSKRLEDLTFDSQ